MDVTATTGRRPIWLSPTLAFATLLLAIAAAGGFVYRAQRAETVRSVSDELEVVAKLKKALIEHWLDDSADDLQLSIASPDFLRAVQAWRREGHGSGARRDQLLDDLQRIAKTSHYLEISLRSADDGALLLSTTGDADGVNEREQARDAAHAERPLLEDFHSDAARGAASYLGFYAAVADASSARPQEIVHVAIDPGHALFPLMQQWPGSRTSSETLLARVEPNRLRILSPERRASAAGTTPPGALERAGTLGSALAQGRRGALAGRDNSNIAVIAHAMNVHGSPWILISKIDRSEAFATLDRIAAASTVSIGLLLVTAAWWWAQHRRRVMIEERHRLQQSFLTRRIDILARYANDCIVLCDPDGRISDVNDRCLTTYGYEQARLLTMNVADLRAPHTRQHVRLTLALIRARGQMLFEAEHCRNDGSCFPVEISVRSIEFDGVVRLQAIIRDISERKQAERHIVGLSRLHATTSAVNQAIVRAATLTEAFERVCAACVEHGRLRMAWVGLESQRAGALELMATAGEGASYLDDRRLRQGGSVIMAPEPTSIAMLRRHVHVCNDLSASLPDDATRASAARHGLAAAIALPLRRAGATVGALTAYSAELDVFDSESVGLLREMAENLSFAIEHFAHQEESRRAEAALRRNEARLQHAQRIGQIGDWEYDRRTHWVSVSPELNRMLGRAPTLGTMRPSMLWAYASNSRVAELKRAIRRAVRNAARVVVELRIDEAQGAALDLDITIVPEVDARGRLVQLHGTVQDVSARRQLERERDEHVRRLAELSQRVVSVQEDERRRLSSDLHDRTGANLAAIGLNLKVIGRAMPRAGAEQRALLDETRQLIGDTVLSIREVCAELRPAILDRGGICAALEASTLSFGRRTGIAVRLDLDRIDGRCGADVESMLFRVAQEALTNCAKHSRASSVRVQLACVDATLRLSIADDGVGFDGSGAPGTSGGLGMTTMRERAEFVGARLTVRSAAGQGTRVDVICAQALPRGPLALRVPSEAPAEAIL